jgi:hypothetical protein
MFTSNTYSDAVYVGDPGDPVPATGTNERMRAVPIGFPTGVVLLDEYATVLDKNCLGASYSVT